MDDRIERYWSLKPSEFPRLDVLAIREAVNDRGAHLFALEVVFHPSDSSSTDRLRLAFDGVTDLSFTAAGSVIQISPLLIESIRDRGWEDIAYEVTDHERSIHFLLEHSRPEPRAVPLSAGALPCPPCQHGRDARAA